MLSIFVLAVVVFFTTQSTDKASPVKSDMPVYRDTASKPKAVDRWAPVSATDARTLAAEQGGKWKKAYADKKILIGLGPDGATKLKALLNTSEANSRLLLTQLLKEADLCLTKPLPVYKDPAAVVKGGKTQVVADNEEWQRWWGDQAVLLSVAARISDKPAYKQRLHDLVLLMCTFRSWGAAVPNADLAAGQVARGIAMAWNWNPDLWQGEERKMILDTVRKRLNILCGNIYGGPGKAWWAGTYLANHNQVPVNGAAFCGVAFINDIPEASEWLAASWLNFQQVLKHSFADGSCAEGTAYYTYTMSFILQFIEGTNGVIDSYALYDAPFLKNAATYRINNSTPGLEGIVCWGDSDPHDFYGPAHYMLRLSSQYKDAQARYIATNVHPGTRGGEDVMAWAWLWSLPAVEETPPTQLDYHAEVSDLINSRSGWKNDDYLFTFKSGYTNTLHSHLDAGAFALILGRDWLLPMPGYGKGKDYGDFWDRNNGRWQYLSNSTEANNTLIINQQQQRHDAEARGTIDHYASFENSMIAECDLTTAYNGAQNVRRKVFHKRGEYIIIKDAVDLNVDGMVEWLLQAPVQSVFSNNKVDIEGKDGIVKVQLLSPVTSLTKREPFSAKNDLPENRGTTVSASIQGKRADFVAVVEPKISTKENSDKTFSVSPDGSVLIKTPGSEEKIIFSDTRSKLTDGKTSATARMLFVKSTGQHLNEITATDATKISAGSLQLQSQQPFDADILANGRSWVVQIAENSNISVKVSGGLKVSRLKEGRKTPQGTVITGPGKYVLE